MPKAARNRQRKGTFPRAYIVLPGRAAAALYHLLEQIDLRNHTFASALDGTPSSKGSLARAMPDLLDQLQSYAFHCEDCAAATEDEYYIVQDEIWKAHGAGVGMLCIGCLERRLGRKLGPQDFPKIPVNTLKDWSRSPRLKNRLGIDDA